jgi:hypothetical protein
MSPENYKTMGAIANAMINGELCEGCGVYLGKPTGYPRLCEGCGADDDTGRPVVKDKANGKKKGRNKKLAMG